MIFKVLGTWVRKISGSYLGVFYFRIDERIEPKKVRQIFLKNLGRPITHILEPNCQVKKIGFASEVATVQSSMGHMEDK